MNYPFLAGQKFKTNFSEETFTVSCFFLANGVEYKTIAALIMQSTSILNPYDCKKVNVKTEEYPQGATRLIDCELI